MEALPSIIKNMPHYDKESFKRGEKVGCYVLGKVIGEGSFAKVREGIHILTGERVAVKIINKKRSSEYTIKNLYREARIMQLIRHENIVELYEVMETKDYYYLVLEFCPGGELIDYIFMMERLTENLARRLIKQLISAVQAMHKTGIVHRDLKIENFLLTDDNDLKIIDFGLSNTTPVATYDRTGVFPQLLNTCCGSPAYAAPELLAEKYYGPQVDVWSIGINMYVMLTGYLPFTTKPFNIYKMYENMRCRKIRPMPNYLSKECKDLLMRLLEPVPEWRISLKEVTKHKWIDNKVHIPRPLSVVIPTNIVPGLYTRKELCECPT